MGDVNQESPDTRRRFFQIENFAARRSLIGGKFENRLNGAEFP